MEKRLQRLIDLHETMENLYMVNELKLLQEEIKVSILDARHIVITKKALQ